MIIEICFRLESIKFFDLPILKDLCILFLTNCTFVDHATSQTNTMNSSQFYIRRYEHAYTITLVLTHEEHTVHTEHYNTVIEHINTKRIVFFLFGGFNPNPKSLNLRESGWWTGVGGEKKITDDRQRVWSCQGFLPTLSCSYNCY
jgi:hypothetical protein